MSHLPSVLWRCWLGGRKGIRPVKNWLVRCWRVMPLPLTISCFSKIQIGFTFLVLAHPGSPEQRAIKPVCVIYLHILPEASHKQNIVASLSSLTTATLWYMLRLWSLTEYCCYMNYIIGTVCIACGSAEQGSCNCQASVRPSISLSRSSSRGAAWAPCGQCLVYSQGMWLNIDLWWLWLLMWACPYWLMAKVDADKVVMGVPVLFFSCLSWLIQTSS